MLARLVSDSSRQMIHLSQPLKVLGLQARATASGQEVVFDQYNVTEPPASPCRGVQKTGATALRFQEFFSLKQDLVLLPELEYCTVIMVSIS